MIGIANNMTTTTKENYTRHNINVHPSFQKYINVHPIDMLFSRKMFLRKFCLQYSTVRATDKWTLPVDVQ
jgi:hypothetical protein